MKSGETLGKVSAEAANATGITESALIIAGAHDQSYCAVSAGIMKPGGVAMDSMGTTENLLCVCEEPICCDEAAQCNIPCCIYSKNDLYACLSFLTSSGSILKWYMDIVARDGEPLCQYNWMAQERKRPSSVMLLPYFSGSGTSYMNNMATGVLSGLTLGIDRVYIYLAIFEGTVLRQACAA